MQGRERPHSSGAAVVGRFFGDHHVVYVTLTQALAGDADELGVVAQIRDRFGAGVAHAGAQAAHELTDDRGQGAAMRNAAFDAFWNQLFVGRAALAVAILAALFHGAQRAHAAVLLVAAALVEHELTRGFVRAGEEGAIITAEAPAAIALVTSPEYLMPPSAMIGMP